jgi:hypothetical protein
MHGFFNQVHADMLAGRMVGFYPFFPDVIALHCYSAGSLG